MKLITSVIVCCIIVGVHCDVSHILAQYSTTTTTTHPPPPHPYAFSYSAGRYPGHIDRTHSEQGDGSGVVRGTFSYVDPRHEVRTVEYVADSQGFHPSLSHPQASLPEESEAVKLARERHQYLFTKIAEEHAQPIHPVLPADAPQDSAAVAYGKEKHAYLYSKIAEEHAQQIHPVLPADAPKDSAAVAYGKEKHANLFAAIAEEHARIGAEHETQRLAFEATSVPNDIQVPYEEYYKPQY